MKRNVNIPCCICSSCESSLLFEINYDILKGMFSIRKCKSCGLLFNSPRLINEELFKLYGKDYYFFWRNESDEFRRITNIYLRTIALLNSEVKQKKVLEIGSAKGYLLALLKYLNWDIQGIEISAEAAQYAQKKLDIPTFNGTIEEYVKEDHEAKYPLVLAIDLIEHVPDPRSFIESVNMIIEDNGLLIIDTPNGGSKNIDILGSEWIGFNPFHIYLFSAENLQLLLKKMGYSIEKVFSYGNQVENTTKGRPTYIKRALKGTLKFILLKLGLFGISKRIYFMMLQVKYARAINTNLLLAGAAKILEQNSHYLYSEDAKGELAKGFKGNNIVVIAKKLTTS
jgi:2-polyprenyl-3-methyl-5-hydroxy-6-metoxy-1,4-benzoquinol methylase